MDDEELDKVIATWKHVIAHALLSKGLTECITKTIAFLEQLRGIRE